MCETQLQKYLLSYFSCNKNEIYILYITGLKVFNEADTQIELSLSKNLFLMQRK